MEARVEEKGQVLRHVSVQVSGEVYRQEQNKAYSDLSKRAKLKGFRKGKVPRSVLKKMYGRQVRADAMRILGSQELQAAVSKIENILHVSTWTIDEEKTEDGGFAFSVDVEVKPELEPKGYLGLDVEVSPVVVTEEEVDEQIEHLRTHYTTFEPVEGRDIAETGDVLTIDFKAIGGGPLEKFQADDQTVELGSGRSIAGLEDALVGAKAGESLEVVITLPETYSPSPDLAGESITLEVEVKAIKTKIIPELDDEFARDTGEAETLDELKTKTRERLEEAKKAAQREEASDKVRAQLREEISFELPHGYIQERANHFLNDQAKGLVQRGLDADQAKQLVELRREQITQDVSQHIQDEFILDAIAAREEIQVEEEARSSFLRTRAEQTGLPVAQLVKIYQSPGMSEHLDIEVKRQQVLDMIVDQANLIEVEPKESEPEEVASETPTAEESTEA